ncbi:asparagine synthetase domain-containing protein 1 [Prorops nasuta]|uniref:asparagine synthetase domain-containing protein 1 n=1 Tax=Prorops nasuta TaxID=863751 RepID=UPI0034CEA6D7
MCGIYCKLCGNSTNNLKEPQFEDNEWTVCKGYTSARGPDALYEKFETLNKDWLAHFAASILWTQGPELISQPRIDPDGNILLWNGDIFSGNLAVSNMCDTVVISNILSKSTDIVSVFQQVEGPYSFIYFQKSKNLLYFGRDVIGRHSLLIKVDNDQNVLTLTSVASKKLQGTVEIPAIGIFVMNLANKNINLACYPWKEPDLRFTDVLEALETSLNIDIDINSVILMDNPTLHLYLHPDPEQIEYLENAPNGDDIAKVLEYLLGEEAVYKRVEQLSQLLHKAVEIRITKNPNYCKACMKIVLKGDNIECTHAKVGILFSGGLDSAILALIADKFVAPNESIDLINVAFEKIVNLSNRGNKVEQQNNLVDQYNVPDRKTGRETYSELSRINPNRKWNFIETNITQEELQLYRSSRIKDLLYPLCTILDESLGCAVWFASRAKGILSGTNTNYESVCRILLLGMGADELFGGYMRHRTMLKHKGWDALTQELHVELARISERNLGRDDRIVSDHGRQSRLPYLDENVVKYVQQLKPWERCYPTDKMPAGLGDKLLLRLLAYRLGFKKTANFPKRAFQFGSRIANSKENAMDISDRL